MLLIVVWAVVEVMHTFLHWVCEDAKIPFLDRHRYNRRGDSGLNGILTNIFGKAILGTPSWSCFFKLELCAIKVNS
jgi:hypothetical protein